MLKKRSLLLRDQFCAHKTDKVKDVFKNLKTSQAMISGGPTSVLQPLDVVLNKPFKDRLRKKWLAWMSLEDDKPVTKGRNFKKPSISLVVSWVTSAWEDIPEDMVKKSFLKTGVSNDLDGGMTMATLMIMIFMLKIVYHQHGMLMMYLKKTRLNYLMIVIIAILIGFK